MKRVLLVLAALATVAAAMTPSVASARTRVVKLSYTAKLTDINVTDLGATGASAGDIQTFTITVDGAVTGHGFCLFQINPFATCTVATKDGTKGYLFATWEENATSLVQHAAIVGGTGRHRNTRGEATITQVSMADPTTYRIDARLIG